MSERKTRPQGAPSAGTNPATEHGRICRRCHRPGSEHAGAELACPDGSGKALLLHRPRQGASHSFSGEQLELLAQVLGAIREGAELAPFARDPAMPSLARTVQTMKRTAEARKRERAAPDPEDPPDP